MRLIEWNHPIETLPPGRPDEAFTVRVRLRCAYRRLQHWQRHRTKGFVHRRREDAIAIMDDPSIRDIQRKADAELLDRPFRGRVLRQIPVHDSARTDVKEDEHVYALERGRH